MNSWVTIAEGDAQTVKAQIPNVVLPKGTPVRIEFDLKVPIAYAYNISGAEQLIRAKIPEGLELKDVHAEGMSRIVAECESDPVPVLGIIAFGVAAAIVLAGLGFMIILIRVKAPDEIVKKLLAEARNVTMGIVVLVVAGIVVLAYMGRV